MNDLLNALGKVPAPVMEVVMALLGAVVKLVMADTSAEREEALMQAAEATKKALDAEKFGG